MDARRSFYFAPGQDDLAEAALDANCLDWDDIPFVAPANGGTGFLGRRVVHQLRDSGATVRIASRQADDANVKQVRADAHDERSVEAAAAGADGVVDAISLYVEHGSETFHSVHVETHALAIK